MQRSDRLQLSRNIPPTSDPSLLSIYHTLAIDSYPPIYLPKANSPHQPPLPLSHPPYLSLSVSLCLALSLSFFSLSSRRFLSPSQRCSRSASRRAAFCSRSALRCAADLRLPLWLPLPWAESSGPRPRPEPEPGPPRVGRCSACFGWGGGWGCSSSRTSGSRDDDDDAWEARQKGSQAFGDQGESGAGAMASWASWGRRARSEPERLLQRRPPTLRPLTGTWGGPNIGEERRGRGVKCGGGCECF